MPTNDSFEALLHDTHELEKFLHELIEPLVKRRPKLGEDVTHYAEQLGLKIPAALKGIPIEWAGAPGSDGETAPAGQQTLTLVRPGLPEAVGFTIGCVRIRRWTVCLECGWLYCRIVIKGTF